MADPIFDPYYNNEVSESLMDFKTLNSALMAQLDVLLPQWLPEGKQIGREYRAGGLNGSAGKSFGINLDTGLWSDFATGEKGGDPISLYAAVKHLSQKQSFLELAPQVGHTVTGTFQQRVRLAHNKEKQPELVAPPEDAPIHKEFFTHPTHGPAADVHVYRDRDGRVWSLVARYERDDGKQFCPFTWDKQANKWRPKGPPQPTMLYNLPSTRLGGKVIVCEGEKAANAAMRYFPRQPVVSWQGGVARVMQADWTPLEGREVILWPDNDEPGAAAMARLAEHLINDRKCKVSRLEVSDLPAKGDAADLTIPVTEAGAWARPRLKEISPKPLTKRGTPPEKDSGQVITEGAIGSQVTLWNEWGLTQTNRGPHENLDNAIQIIQASGRATVWYDEFLNRVLWVPPGEKKPREWTETDDLDLTQWIQRNVGLHRMQTRTVRDAVMAHAQRNRRNSLVEWLQGLVWDGKPRIERFMPNAFGTPADPYYFAVGRSFLRSMVARAVYPGCQADYVPVFEGPQGLLKSSCLRALAQPWFSEIHETIGSLRWQELIQGIWLVEMAELQAFRQAEIERIKSTISNRVDRFRPAYARSPMSAPRRQVLCGTTNSDNWLTDPTGGRRFWPVVCTKADVEWITANRDQLFAEAYRDVMEGRDWWKVPETEARAHQEARREEDPLEDRIRQFVAVKEFVTSFEVLEALGFSAPQMTRVMQVRVGTALRAAGWIKTVKFGAKGYRRPIGNLPLEQKEAPAAEAPEAQGGVDHEAAPDEF
jgi:putative DNA primase/helicase